MLAYNSTNAAEDGKYRRIQVKLAPRLANLKAKLDYRQGYFAPATFANMHDADKETQLQQALESANPITDLPLAVEVDYFRLAKDKYFVPITVRLPGSALSFEAKGSKRATALDFIAQVRDAKGRAVDAVRDSIPLKIDEATPASWPQTHPIRYRHDACSRQIHAALRRAENGEGKIGTFETPFTVPQLDSEKTLRLSSLVLSNRFSPSMISLPALKTVKKFSHRIRWSVITDRKSFPT